MVLRNLGAGHGDECFGLDAVVGMFSAQIENELFDRGPNFLERHRRRHAHIQKNVGAMWSPADTPWEPGANAADVHNAWLAVVSSFFLPRGNPVINGVEELFHAENGAVVLLSAGECRVNVVAARREPHPNGAVVAKYELHIRGLTENAHVRQDAVIQQMISAHAVTTKFLPNKFVSPLCLLGLAEDRWHGRGAF